MIKRVLAKGSALPKRERCTLCGHPTPWKRCKDCLDKICGYPGYVRVRVVGCKAHYKKVHGRLITVEPRLRHVRYIGGTRDTRTPGVWTMSEDGSIGIVCPNVHCRAVLVIRKHTLNRKRTMECATCTNCGFHIFATLCGFNEKHADAWKGDVWPS